MARCHRPEWLAAVRKERLMTEQRLATAKGHHSQLTVEKGKAHIRLSFFGRPLSPPPGPSSYKIETRAGVAGNATIHGRDMRCLTLRSCVHRISLFSNLSQIRRRAESDLSSNWIVPYREAIHMSDKSNHRMTLIRQQIAPPAERYPAISVPPRLVSVPAHANPGFGRY